MFLERFILYDPCLQHVIHSLFDSDIYVSINLLVVQVIFVYDLLENDFYCYLSILIILYWIFQIEVPGIYNKGFSVWCVEDAIPMDFGNG